MQKLETISLPLDRAGLIEASAGTGKTYTMANLYLRLILGVGCAPLLVEQILVVTFTKASTQELRDRIRAKLIAVADLFERPELDAHQQTLASDPFLSALFEQLQPRRNEARLRLKVAIQDIDLASIFTIDSFCQKMLFQFAFDSGIRFDIDLQADESALLQRLSEESWRELFYSASRQESEWAAAYLGNPAEALAQVKHLLSGILPPLSEAQQAFLAADSQKQAVACGQFIADCQRYWQKNASEIIAPLEKALNAEASPLNKTSYKAENLTEKWLPALNAWAMQKNAMKLPLEWQFFTASQLAAKTKKGEKTPESAYFDEMDARFQTFQQQFANTESAIKTRLIYRYFNHLADKLRQFKDSHSQKNYQDMLVYFHQALSGKNGERLAEKIRQQFAFAMVDESQDTDQLQNQIFRRIFMSDAHPMGFIMIGDPKQSIYKFRGADIFSYLEAKAEIEKKEAKAEIEKKNEASGVFTLNHNWRSLPSVVEAINQLFNFDRSFIYSGIKFSPVESRAKGELPPNKQAMNVYIYPKNADLAEHCAEQIAQQLQQAAAGESLVKNAQGENERPLQPKDIAILVRSRTEAHAIKQALAKRQLQAVYLSEKSSVYQTPEAADLCRILTACLNPFDQKSLLAALGCHLWGLNANEIYQSKQSETKWDICVEDFVQYQQIWQQQGVLPMLHQLYLQHIIPRLKASPNADRRITNLLHLAELLQARMESTETPASLLRWFVQQVETGGSEEDDEQILRLESEADLIKIITIHKSKGLEYPVVWLPFIGKSERQITRKTLELYRKDSSESENQKEAAWALGDENDEVKKLITEEAQAEALRLLYVALTRAKYQFHLLLPEVWGSSWNAMHYLLTDGSPKDKDQTQDCLNKKGLACNVVALAPVASLSKFTPTESEAALPAAKVFSGDIQATGQITSFSALQAQNERRQHFAENRPLASLRDSAQDYDQQSHTAVEAATEANGEENGAENNASGAFLAKTEMPPFSPYQFPHSAKVGNVLHHYLERLDFRQHIALEGVQALCEQLQLSPEWIEPTQDWLENIRTTVLTENGLQLAQLQPSERLNEWQFYLRLRNKNALPKLNQLLKKQRRFKDLPDLHLPQLEGFVRGFIDCIAKFDGKYYLIDYKSNFLGDFPQDYRPEQLAKTMTQYRYDLQYLLYTLALHRYLRSRLGEHYDYERDFGGVAYLFLRAMDGTPTSGVFFDKPSLALINGVDGLFEGE